jgi:hypothetical protein
MYLAATFMIHLYHSPIVGSILQRDTIIQQLGRKDKKYSVLDENAGI